MSNWCPTDWSSFRQTLGITEVLKLCPSFSILNEYKTLETASLHFLRNYIIRPTRNFIFLLASMFLGLIWEIKFQLPSILVPGLHIYFHNFYCKCSYYLPLRKTDPRSLQRYRWMIQLMCDRNSQTQLQNCPPTFSPMDRNRSSFWNTEFFQNI
jgi:hypothetical protein